MKAWNGCQGCLIAYLWIGCQGCLVEYGYGTLCNQVANLNGKFLQKNKRGLKHNLWSNLGIIVKWLRQSQYELKKLTWVKAAVIAQTIRLIAQGGIPSKAISCITIHFDKRDWKTRLIIFIWTRLFLNKIVFEQDFFNKIVFEQVQGTLRCWFAWGFDKWQMVANK